MSSWVWFAFTETSAVAGKNYEYPEIDAWLSDSNIYTAPNELQNKAPSTTAMCPPSQRNSRSGKYPAVAPLT